MMDCSWTTGGDPHLTHTRKIGVGGGGTVHEVFARKLLNLGILDTSSVQNEIRAITKLCDGTNKHIIKVLAHGEFTSMSYVFIDMELCDFDLEEYIKSIWIVSRADHYSKETGIWNVMRQIASGLQFVHGNREVHRDLKPRNDRVWKLADFGISSEMTTGMITLYSKGTPGYRAPELLLENPKYNEKVDIWALGCILHELVVGSKPFSSDIAVRDYRHSQSLDLGDCDPLFKDSILEMLQLVPESRPTATGLYTSFSRYYRDSAKASQPVKVEIVTPLPEMEKWRAEKLTWAEPNTDVVFVDDTVTEGSDWTVLVAIVNKPTTRVATVSIDEDHIYRSVKLWNITGELLWEKQEVFGEIHEVVQPTFSEDGKHLAVYSKDVVEIIDARRAIQANKFSVKDTKITAISIARNGRTLAVATDKSHTNEKLDDACLSKEVFDKPVDVVTTILISNVSIAYLASGRRLFAVGKPLPVAGVGSRPLRGFCWDLNSRALLQKFNFGNLFSYFESPINIITLFNEPCLYMRIGYLQGTVHCSGLFYTAEGRLFSETHESRCVHGVCPQGIVYIRSHEKLEIFDSKKRGEIASIQSDELPPILEIKALGVLENQVIIVADDERFIFLRKH